MEQRRVDAKINPNRLKMLARAKDGSLNKFVRNIGISIPAFKDYCSGKRDMPYEVYLNILDHLEVTPEELAEPPEFNDSYFRELLSDTLDRCYHMSKYGTISIKDWLDTLKTVTPYFLAKKVSTEGTVDPFEVAQKLIDARKSILTGSTMPDDMSEVETDVLKMLEVDDVKSPSSRNGSPK